MQALTLGGAELPVTLDGGEAFFTAQVEGDRLTLSADELGPSWQLDGYALDVLAASGIAEIALTVDGGTCVLPTGEWLDGRVYASLRAAGYVSQDFLWLVSGEGMEVQVDGEVYQVIDGLLALREE